MKVRIIIILAITLVTSSCKKYIENKGAVYGTFYSIKYESPSGKDLQNEIESEFERYTQIFSHYEKTSTISKINNNEDVWPEPEFITCYEKAMEISEITQGAFDITAGDLINAWGFGPEEKEKMTPEKVDSLLQITGFQKIQLENGKIVKEEPRINLNMSAISKGYTCDLIGHFLTEKGVQNYMIDIGGEVVTKGVNAKGKVWSIGIRKPIENILNEEIQTAIQLPDKALATSGNYLNFYIENGKKYGHTIDPRTGYPVQHSILSSSVLANDCMTADAYATTFMVLGVEKGIEIARKVPDIEVYFIYADENGENQIYMSNGFKKYIQE